MFHKGDCVVTRFFMSIGNLVFAFFLGAVALVVTAIQFPGVFEVILNWAGVIKTNIITSISVSEEGRVYKNLVRYLIEESQLVFMFFVIAARIILSLLMWLVTSLLGLKS